MFSIAILDCPGLYPGPSTAHQDGQIMKLFHRRLGHCRIFPMNGCYQPFPWPEGVGENVWATISGGY